MRIGMFDFRKDKPRETDPVSDEVVVAADDAAESPEQIWDDLVDHFQSLGIEELDSDLDDVLGSVYDDPELAEWANAEDEDALRVLVTDFLRENGLDEENQGAGSPVPEIAGRPTEATTDERVTELTAESGVELAAETTAESPIETAAESGVELAAETTAESTIETAAESGVELAAETTAESTTEPAAESNYETAAESTIEPPAETTAVSSDEPNPGTTGAVSTEEPGPQDGAVEASIEGSPTESEEASARSDELPAAALTDESTREPVAVDPPHEVLASEPIPFETDAQDPADLLEEPASETPPDPAGPSSSMADMGVSGVVKDEVVLRLLHRGVIRVSDVFEALRRKAPGSPLWRALLLLDGIDQNEVLAEVADQRGYMKWEFPSGIPDFGTLHDIQDELPSRVVQALAELDAVPVEAGIDPKTLEYRVIIATSDPDQPKLKKAASGAGVATEFRYMPESEVKRLRRGLGDPEDLPPDPVMPELEDSTDASLRPSGQPPSAQDDLMPEALEDLLPGALDDMLSSDTGSGGAIFDDAIPGAIPGATSPDDLLPGVLHPDANLGDPMDAFVPDANPYAEPSDPEGFPEDLNFDLDDELPPASAGIRPDRPESSVDDRLQKRAQNRPWPKKEAPAPPTEKAREVPGDAIVENDLEQIDARARKDRVVAALFKEGKIAVSQVAEAVKKHGGDAGREALWRVLTGVDGVDREAVFQKAAQVYAFPEEQLVSGRPDHEFVMLIMETIAEERRDELLKLNLIPFEYAIDLETGGARLIFVTHDPARPEVHRLLAQLKLGRFELHYASEMGVRGVISDVFPRRNEFLDRMTDDPVAMDIETDFGPGNTDLVDEEALEAEISRSTLINLFEAALVDAVRTGASDIHIYPNPHRQIEIHMRTDGRLRRWHVEDKVHPESFLAVVKDNSTNVDRFERDAAQDGFIQRRIDDALIRFRVSVLPIATANQEIRAESVVIRVLDDRKVLTDLRQLGMLEGAMERLEHAIHQPHGMVILTGPTGSGKSTTLVAALHRVISPEVNVLTIEDPVEYIINGVRQIKLSHKLDLEAAIRAVLRHDPDIVMVGEMRDRATADLAIKLANTGHLTFSTLHTNDAPSAISRLYKMGVEPFLLAYAINLVVAQRLVRALCSSCKVEDLLKDPVQMKRLGFSDEAIESMTIYRAGANKKCDACGGKGYKGRRAISETLYFTSGIRHLVAESGEEIDEEAVRAQAIKDGMLTLGDSARVLVERGITSVEEMMRTTASE